MVFRILPHEFGAEAKPEGLCGNRALQGACSALLTILKWPSVGFRG